MADYKPQRGRVRENFVRGVRLAWEASPRTFLGITALGLVSALIPPVVVWLGKHLVDLIVSGAHGVLHFKDLWPTVLGLGILAGISRALGQIQAAEQELFSRRVTVHARQRFYEKASGVDFGHFDNSEWHDRMQRARRDISWRPYQLAYSTIGLATSVVTVLGMLALLAKLHPLLVALSLVSLVPMVTIQRRITRRLYDWWLGHTAEEREEEYFAEVLGDLSTAKELRSFGLWRFFLDRFGDINRRRYSSLARFYRHWSWAALVSGAAGGAALVGAYGFVAARGLTGALTAGDLAAVIGAFASVTAQSSLISSSLLSLEQHATFLDDYFSFLGIEPLVLVPDHPTQLPGRLDGGIVLKRVHFTYPRGIEEALSGVDLEVRPGELIAMVGENGAGKSTIVNLMLRFYDADKGTVQFGGVDLRNVDPADLRSRIGVLFQDFAKFQLSLRDNVRIGRLERDVDDVEILASLESARADFLVKSMKHGLDSRAGRLFDGGHELSGGEWQRLALARLMHRQADVWILDEPTSNLDPEAEAAIFSELKAQLHGRMGIVISHRFSTVRVADKIYVIQDGRVLESGSHDELVAHGGRYAELFELQAAGYR
jgi:ABC-type multidrug transport system fused ATPase/permease subunit